ncbi:hypothetical protein [Caldalkalibacillus salinus]|uniref:hypothetical protein n=1 Tax=Caldalkalibacillus salinus TaxID=2803787 RepID=UPI00192140E4|nr:hypothetical protein [Caldalkalibacillus salinus]
MNEEGYTIDQSMDAVDIEAFKDGAMRMNLFIRWSDGDIAMRYGLYYKDNDDNILQYTLSSDGGETVVQIN